MMRNQTWKGIRNLVTATCFIGFLGNTIECVKAESLASQGAFRTVALTGQQVPNFPAGVLFERFSEGALLGAGGQVAFRALIAGPGIVELENGTGIWAETAAGILRKAAQSGDQAPELEPGAIFSNFSDLRIDRSGNVSYAARLKREGPIDFENQTVFYTERGGNGPKVLAQEGSSAPGTPFSFNDLFLGDHPFLSSTGNSAFVAELREPLSMRTAIWSDRDGQVELVIRQGDSLPGLGAGATLGSISEINPFAVNPSGDLAFVGTVCHCTPPNITHQAIIVEDRPNGFRTAAAFGEQAPGLSDGVMFGSFTDASVPSQLVSLGFNGTGQTAFFSTLSGSIVSSTNNSSVWSEAGGQLHLVAREGDQAPGVPNGLVFGSFGNTAFTSELLLSENGTVLLHAPLRSGDTIVSEGLWAEDPNNGLRPIIVTGDVAPGTEPLTIFDSFFNGGVDSSGRFYVSGVLSGPSVDESNNAGIWSGFGRDSLKLLVREGDMLEVSPDDWRTIASFGNPATVGFLSASGLADGRQAGFNDLGQATFVVQFTDGTEGVLVVTVPEPASWIIFAIFGTGTFIGFCRHQ